MAEAAEGQRHLLDVDELATEVGMRGQMAVGRVEVALGVEEREMHPASLRTDHQCRLKGG